MSHFAHITNGVVDEVIVAEQPFVSALPNASEWVQTSFNTIGGVHVDPVTRQPDGGTPLNKNYAGIGYTWDGTGFAAPQPYPSWTLDHNTYQWNAPVPYPSDGKMYSWDEPTGKWINTPTI